MNEMNHRLLSQRADDVSKDCPRLLINREKVGIAENFAIRAGVDSGFRFDSETNYREALLNVSSPLSVYSYIFSSRIA